MYIEENGFYLYLFGYFRYKMSENKSVGSLKLDNLW